MDDLISRLSEIRSQYNCFNESEEPYYRALSEVIKMLSGKADEDTISRQAAIEAIAFDEEMLRRVLDDMDVVGVDREKYAWGLGLIESLIDDMRELPSAQSEPKQKEGTWMGGDLGYLTCCGVDGCASDMWNFCEDKNICYCPNCGARITKFISYWDEGYMKKKEWLKTKGVSTKE